MGKGDKKSKKGKIFKSSYGNSRRRKKKMNNKVLVRKSSIKKNSTCYMSLEKITEVNKSLEHIIPNALGGRLKSNDILNEHWNNKLGDEIDSKLTKQIPLPTLLDIQRDRGKGPKLAAKTEDGTKYLVDRKLEAKKRPAKPKETTLPDGKKKIEFVEGQEGSILKSLKKKYPQIDINDLRKRIKWTTPNDEKPFFFEDHLSLINGPEAARAICKIAANFYVFSAKEVKEIQQIVPFIKGEATGLGKLKYYYPKNKSIHTLGKDEISHIIYIKGDKKEKLLYAYIELFSCHAFLIILNDNYQGKDISYSYCYDLKSNKELKKDIKLDLTKEEVSKFNFPQDKDNEKDYFDKLQRVADIKGFKLDIRKIKDLK